MDDARTICIASGQEACSARSVPDLSLVIPCWNEAGRLPQTLAALQRSLAEWPIDCEVIVVDDGSTDQTFQIADQLGGQFTALRLDRNSGKGAAVRAGMLHAVGRVVAFTDADLPYHLEALLKGYRQIESGKSEVVLGARDDARSTQAVPRPWLRRLASWTFQRLVAGLVAPCVQDSQCGLKLFSRHAAREVFSRTKISGFAFDVEIIYLVRRLGLSMARVPVMLVNDAGSTVSLRRHAWAMLLDVLGLYVRAWRISITSPQCLPVPAVRESIQSVAA